MDTDEVQRIDGESNSINSDQYRVRDFVLFSYTNGIQEKCASIKADRDTETKQLCSKAHYRLCNQQKGSQKYMSSDNLYLSALLMKKTKLNSITNTRFSCSICIRLFLSY